MPRSPRRRPVHYTTFVFSDGAAATCTPSRKPSAKTLKAEGRTIDVDFICKEFHFAVEEFEKLPGDARARISDILANRLNMHRALREIVLPVLNEMKDSLDSIRKRLDRLERSQSD
jgi:hypothetical protein